LSELGREIRRRLKAVACPTVFLGLVAYFAWHATQGELGIVAMHQREQLLAEARAELARAEAERDAWERRVAALRGPRLDADMLDERARAMLNLGDPHELIVPYGSGNRLY
jgi:cell division protein FtsB